MTIALPVTATDDAVDIALTARRAMQLLRDSTLPGQAFYHAADSACAAIDDVIVEARRIAEARR